MVLSVISEIAGFVIALAALALLWQQKVFIDGKKVRITKIELPFGIRLQTSSTVFAIVFIGAALIIIPQMKSEGRKLIALKGHISTRQPLMVYAIEAQQETNGDVLLEVPENARYTVMFLPRDGATAIDSQSVDLVKRHTDPFSLRELEVSQLLAGNNEGVPSTPVHTEPANVVSQFK